jgi:hypothetical protein
LGSAAIGGFTGFEEAHGGYFWRLT